MNLQLIAFYFFAGIIVVSGLVILFTKNLLYAAFSLIFTFLGVAAIYVFAGADFLAVAQVLIYVGGVLVLLIFGIMLTNKISGQSAYSAIHYRGIGFLIAGFTVFILIVVFFNAKDHWHTIEMKPEINNSSVNLLGIQLMSNFVLPFEIIAIILLIALIGAAYIAKHKTKT